jgi:hypothetical protein
MQAPEEGQQNQSRTTVVSMQENKCQAVRLEMSTLRVSAQLGQLLLLAFEQAHPPRVMALRGRAAPAPRWGQGLGGAWHAS